MIVVVTPLITIAVSVVMSVETVTLVLWYPEEIAIVVVGLLLVVVGSRVVVVVGSCVVVVGSLVVVGVVKGVVEAFEVVVGFGVVVVEG